METCVSFFHFLYILGQKLSITDPFWKIDPPGQAVPNPAHILYTFHWEWPWWQTSGLAPDHQHFLVLGCCAKLELTAPRHFLCTGCRLFSVQLTSGVRDNMLLVTSCFPWKWLDISSFPNKVWKYLCENAKKNLKPHGGKSFPLIFHHILLKLES